MLCAARESAVRTAALSLLLAILPATVLPHAAAQEKAKDDAGAAAAPADDQKHPFDRRISVEQFEFPPDAEWMNVGGRLRMRDLRGKFVILDFWTYCCINCIHILPELKKLERAYPRELVVIGVHSAKFETEKLATNIREAILRYEIEHPVVNDPNHLIWRAFGARSWPTVLMIDPEGNAVWGRSGEIRFEDVDPLIKKAIPYYEAQGTLDRSPIHFDLLKHRQPHDSPLRFPGKVLADPAGRRLFITDSNHNRIVITDFEGQCLETIGRGTIGRDDGDFAHATFDHPQGVALWNDTLYVADTENHLLRKIDLKAKTVATIAGTGVQGRVAFPGLERIETTAQLPDRWVGKPRETALNSPWALWVHKQDLYIAMAGPHQIWKMPLDESEIGPYAGNGREDIVDGPLLPRQPYQLGFASFAQPSGLASDGTWLYVADSEGSSIRAVPFDPSRKVRTVVGTDQLPNARLFTFGDRDGPRDEVLLQHVLGVVYHEGQLYIADTYNNKIKVVDAETGATRTLAGTGEPGRDDEKGLFDEPAGISYADGTLYVADTNNHCIRTVDIASGRVETLTMHGLDPPRPEKKSGRPDFSDADVVTLDPVTVRAQDKNLQLTVQLALPKGWKINPLAPAAYWVDVENESGPISRQVLGRHTPDAPSDRFTITLPVAGQGRETLTIAHPFYYCQEGAEGLCRVGSVVWKIPLTVDPGGSTEPVQLRYTVGP